MESANHAEHRMKLVCFAVLMVITSFMLLFGVTLFQGYQRVAVSGEAIQSSWDGVAIQLQRRHAAVEAVAAENQALNAHERRIADDAVASIKRYRAADTVAVKAEAASDLEAELDLLLVIVDRHPELHTASSFRELRREILTEGDQLIAARQRYNAAVRNLNGFIRPFPGSCYAAMGRVEPGKYFTMKEASVTPAQIGSGANATSIPKPITDHLAGLL